jgi:hypothetical protein
MAKWHSNTYSLQNQNPSTTSTPLAACFYLGFSSTSTHKLFAGGFCPSNPFTLPPPPFARTFPTNSINTYTSNTLRRYLKMLNQTRNPKWHADPGKWPKCRLVQLIAAMLLQLLCNISNRISSSRISALRLEFRFCSKASTSAIDTHIK